MSLTFGIVNLLNFSPSGGWYLSMVLICISLMINDVEQFFISLSVSWISSFVKCLSSILLTS